MRSLLLATVGALVFASAATAAPQCTTGTRLCGNVCFPAGQPCGVPPPRHCRSGHKQCGSVCIPNKRFCPPPDLPKG
jgi:hypothetical protein